MVLLHSYILGLIRIGITAFAELLDNSLDEVSEFNLFLLIILCQEFVFFMLLDFQILLALV